MKTFFIRFFFLTLFCTSHVYGIEGINLTCERLIRPYGIETPHPRFGWQLLSGHPGDRQTAYHIQVALSSEECRKGKATVWDSGKVTSEESQLIPYAGKPLSQGRKYYWRIRVWDEKGKPSSWSDPEYWWQAHPVPLPEAGWIGAITKQEANLPTSRDFHLPDLSNPATAEAWGEVDSLAARSIYLRRSVDLEKEIESAVVYVSGLGHYKMTVNGNAVSDDEFAPLWSEYTRTVYYNTFDIKEYLHRGENVFGVTLGNGMYNVTGNRYVKFWASFGPPTLYFQSHIRYTDGTEEIIVSDENWEWSASPVVFNCIFGGEDYDANLEQPGWDSPGFSGTGWQQAVLQEAPEGKLTSQLAPPVRIMQKFPVKEVKRLENNRLVFDMGQNLSGFPTIRVKGSKGQVIRLITAESLHPDGTVNQSKSGGPSYFEYTLKGEGEEIWQPFFHYYGYQYIMTDDAGYLSPVSPDRPVILELVSNFVYSSVENTGHFECSNEIFTRTHQLINNAIKSNMHAVFTDCPHREKLGWLEEVHLNGPGIFYNYNVSQLMAKVVRDMADAQHPGGLIPSIVPQYVLFLESDGSPNAFSDSPEWGAAFIVVPGMYYEFYGDDTLIREYYPQMKKYVDYLLTRADGFILSHGLGDWYDYGEHRAGYSRNSPVALSATAHLYLDVITLKRYAEMLGEETDRQQLEKLAYDVRHAFNARFFDPETSQYGTGSQFSNAMPLFLEIVEPEYRQAVLDNLVADIRMRGNRLTTGDIGNRYLFQVLARNGLNELMYDMHNHYDVPGYGFQLGFGLTTLTEQWDPRNGDSWNHFMLGQIEEWFYTTLLGIQADPANPGFKNIILKPTPVGDLSYAKGDYQSVYGRISSYWRVENETFIFETEIPVNTTALFFVPEGYILESLNGTRTNATGNSFPLPSGKYTISAVRKRL